MVTMPSGYHSRFDPEKNYERHLYRVGRVVQGAELNETQESVMDRMQRITDVLFKDGAVIRDAAIIIDQDTGATTLEAGVLYVRGAMRGVAPKVTTVALTGTVVIGVYLQESVVTELQDPTLKDPAIGLRNSSEPGAARLKVVAVWGKAGDGTSGEFYPVYTILNGALQSTAPPPQIDGVALKIAQYDRDSTGGHYISEGFQTTKLPDVSGEQVYGLASGNARVFGKQVFLPHAQRITYPAVADLKQVVAEQHVATGSSQRISLNHAPVDNIGQVLITAQKVVTVQRGAVNGGTDLMPDTPIVSIVAVNQGGTWGGSSFTGGTTYVQGADATTGDYFRSGDGVSWARTGGGAVEPATGSTYTVVYRYIQNVTGLVTGVDSTGFTVAGAVAATNVQVTYHWKRPRIDKLCLNPDGNVVWIKGAPSDVAPRPPQIPEGLLAVSSIHQTWTDTVLTVGTQKIKARYVVNDGTRMQTMPQIESLEAKVDNLFALVSEHHLKTLIALTDPTTKRGVFVDPFDNDDKRDQGVAQNAAIVAGALTLPAVNVTILYTSLDGVQTLPMDWANTYAVISQTLRTGCMLVNPYQNYDPLPIQATIVPATDFWTQTIDTWTSPVTTRFTTEREVIDRDGNEWADAPLREINVTREVLVTNSTQLVSTRQEEAQFLRQIVITFTLRGMGDGELVSSVKFDGISVAFA